MDPGGLDILSATLAEFRDQLRASNHTIKRALMDPKMIDGIGNAYSDEILHDAKLSPFQWTRNLSEEDIERLFASARHLLSTWVERLVMQTGESFPERVTAFRPEMSVHGRFGKPCPVCQAPVQRIRYSERECNYCARCQTNGRILADRSLSRLLRDDWPKTLDEWEEQF